MQTFNMSFDDGDEVQYTTTDQPYYAGIGEVKVVNGEIVGIKSYNKFYVSTHIYAIHHHFKDFDLGKYLKKVELPIKAQEEVLELNKGEAILPLFDINSDYIQYTTYQKVLFELCYWDKSHLEHVNWFAPEACYYPKGWYKLGGVQSDESDRIAELVDLQWQAWRNALLQNMWLDNIKPEKITYKGY